MVLTTLGSTKISNFDGQNIWDKNGNKMYEIGNYLGGGVAGVVYEVERVENLQHFALKILNPVGYKLERKAALKQCKVLVKGDMLNRLEDGTYAKLSARNVWWLIHTPSSAVIAAYHDVEKGDLLREMTLPKCVSVWGLDAVEQPSQRQVICDGRPIPVPTLPSKYVEFLANREKIFREILNMAQLSIHVNVLRLFDVMESIQDSKCTLFLVLELAKGGELFDRIAIDQGASEEVAKNYLGQLLEGLQHCHAQGVCHRDLKPENLLLADDDGCLLKIADFGLSATFRNVDEPLRGGATPLTRTLQSVVGSPFYVAPEVLASQGYDGSKADVWSVGVILYAMLAGNLPFGKDLAVCVRFAKFKQWIETQPLSAPPTWLFPAKASEDVKALLVSMLNPNPTFRISVQEALEHKWVGKKKAEIPPGPPIDKTHSPPSGLYQMLAADCSQSAASPSPTRKASRPMDMFSSPPISNESRNGSPRLESLICDPTDVLEKQLGAIDLRICRKRRKSYPPSGPSGSTGGIDEASGVSSSLPADYKADQSYLIPDQSAACMTPPRMIEEQVVGTPNGSLWSLESPSPHNGSFLMDMFRANANKGAEEPPAFVDHVRRSTRFVTSLPAAEVLGGIEDIINSGAIPLPPPFELQETHMCWDDFRLEVRWDSVLVYSVHVFLLMGEEDSSRCDYLVEFRRGQMEIFDFKRYYETVLERLSRYIKDDPRVLDYRATGVLPDSSTGFSFFPFSDE